MNGAGVWKRSRLTEWAVGGAASPLVGLLVVESVEANRPGVWLKECRPAVRVWAPRPTAAPTSLLWEGPTTSAGTGHIIIFSLRVQRWVKWEYVTRQNCDRIPPKLKLCITARWIHSCSIILVFSSRAEKTNTDDIVDVFALRETLYLSNEGFRQLSDIHTRLPHRTTTHQTVVHWADLPQGQRRRRRRRRMLLLRGPLMVAAELVQIWTDIPLVTRPQQGWHLLLSAAASDFLFPSRTLCLASICHHFFVGSSRLKRIMWQNFDLKGQYPAR